MEKRKIMRLEKILQKPLLFSKKCGMIDKHEKNPPVCSGSDRRGECQKNDIQSDSPLTGTVSGHFFIFYPFSLPQYRQAPL